MKTFETICTIESIQIPTTLTGARRVQRYRSDVSIQFILDKKSKDYLQDKLPFLCNETFLKKMAENILILHYEKHRKTDIRRLTLMNQKDIEIVHFIIPETKL